MTTSVRIGLLRLVDSAPVLVAEERGLFADLGLEVTLSIEPSWSNAADKLAYGLLDAAVMLPPLALAAAMGLRGAPARLIIPMGLTQGGNTIVLGHAARPVTNQPSGARLLEWLQAQPEPPRFAVVHRFSTHNLLLRYWLALAGADPERDIDTVVVPPELVVDALSAGRIAGFCAGAPWGDVAQQRGAGQVLLGTSSIWPFHPEKCLAVFAPWAEANPEALRRLLRALLRSQILCDLPDEAPRIAALLASPDGLNLPETASRAALPGGQGAEKIHFHTGAAWFPARAHAVWFLEQMRRWGWIEPGVSLEAVAQEVYRPDLLAAAAAAEDSLFFARPGRSPVQPFADMPESGANAFGVVNF
jgi:NitT/TauT family transport system ATP-binding protein/nitrate/nitrite transport system substrate-binding protein